MLNFRRHFLMPILGVGSLIKRPNYDACRQRVPDSQTFFAARLSRQELIPLLTRAA